jgi:hypothetical protein
MVQSFCEVDTLDHQGWHAGSKWKTVNTCKAAQKHVLLEVQQETYYNEIQCLQAGKYLAKSSPIFNLSPFVSADSLLRIGSQHSSLTKTEEHPILVAGHHHIAILLVRHHHQQTQHQVCHITEDSIRSTGFWITVSSVIHKCVKCRKLGDLGSQKMAHLPPYRLELGPKFTNVSVDHLGPYSKDTREDRVPTDASTNKKLV